MPHLDQRLQAVARLIQWHTHADIGSDHGHLLKALLKTGRIRHGIAIENKASPWENSSRTLSGLSAEVRLADGLAGLQEGEADGLSVCGMGGAAIAGILSAFPNRIPSRLIVQPNSKSELVRRWALQAGYDLIDEILVQGTPVRTGGTQPGSRRRFIVLQFESATTPPGRLSTHLDTAYAGIDRVAAELFGPRLIRAWQPDLVASLHEEQAYFRGLVRLTPESAQRLAAIERLLSAGPSPEDRKPRAR
ncbi:class I SAM-dependent methyltransferase [Allorhodopirellula solitaria]|uniref:tRNA (Adenine(22)-N(1))-methyltransferase n=1 Tax=Allorhodopirellula solitaria TaxID=2527987 RepID=A0A5C5XXD4_9BACT|nr:class I SAM-dependent methyltransferase [Allorhodopirellula solitaria]TWT67161.1 tRNA (adenine(22)-N(1))-methyltransferase [Allorhodopirellula solitaria]